MTTAQETETDLQQLTQEILRVTGIIKVNFPALYSAICETPQFTAFEEEQLEENQHQDYLGFLSEQLRIHRTSYSKN